MVEVGVDLVECGPDAPHILDRVVWRRLPVPSSGSYTAEDGEVVEDGDEPGTLLVYQLRRGRSSEASPARDARDELCDMLALALVGLASGLSGSSARPISLPLSTTLTAFLHVTCEFMSSVTPRSSTTRVFGGWRGRAA
jgi:hypothetical protein